MTDLPEKLLTPEDLAKLLCITPRQVREWRIRGDLPRPVISKYRTFRWHPDDIEKFLKRNSGR